MSTLHITRGLPASGKSTWAKAWVAEDPTKRIRINRDEVRIFLNVKHGENEHLVTRVQQTLVTTALRDGLDVVVDDTNLMARYSKEWLKLAAKERAEVEWHDEFLSVDVRTCMDRDRLREGVAKVGPEVIHRMYQRAFPGGKLPKRPELAVEELPVAAWYDGTPGKPKAFLVDLDGTIASNGTDRNNPNRGYFDWHRVGEDLPVARVIEIVRMFEAQGLRAIYVSGRDASCYLQTGHWISHHVYGEIPWNGFPLHMRTEGDMRKDSIVKLEIFDREIRNNYDVQFALDDRNQVVEAYRSIGLTVLQVADGNF